MIHMNCRRGNEGNIGIVQHRVGDDGRENLFQGFIIRSFFGPVLCSFPRQNHVVNGGLASFLGFEGWGNGIEACCVIDLKRWTISRIRDLGCFSVFSDLLNSVDWLR